MARWLLDTHILLWLDAEPERIPRQILAQFDRVETAYFSAASVWELEIKRSVGRIRFDGRVTAFAERAGLAELPIAARHAEAAAALPLHHRDPFDRMLVAQAIAEGLTLVTADQRLRAYPVALLGV
jgi:PIN domain nuclease of toxin-antitoxin system